MKATFKKLFATCPITAQRFSEYLSIQWKISQKVYDCASSDHRYIIASRYLGEPCKVPAYQSDDQLEKKIHDLFFRQENAFILNPADPLKELNNLPFSERTKMNDTIFQRQTKPGIRDSLIPLTNFQRPSLYDALIPFNPLNFDDGAQKALLNDSERQELLNQIELDNIQWSWNVKAGKITVPF